MTLQKKITMFLTKYEQSMNKALILMEKSFTFIESKSLISSATASPPICVVSYKRDAVQTYLLVSLSHLQLG